MPGKFTLNETLNTLRAIFEKHKHERVCVLGTICVGKSTLISHLLDYNCADIDGFADDLPEEETAYLKRLLQKSWTTETGDEIDRLVYKYVKIKPDCPLFTTVILDCEAVVYLDISDELLAEHCKKRGDSFEDAKNIKDAIENDWNDHKARNDKTFYYLTVTE